MVNNSPLTSIGEKIRQSLRKGNCRQEKKLKRDQVPKSENFSSDFDSTTLLDFLSSVLTTFCKTVLGVSIFFDASVILSCDAVFFPWRMMIVSL